MISSLSLERHPTPTGGKVKISVRDLLKFSTKSPAPH